MIELKRICSKKALLILLMIVILNALLFYISAPQNKDITLQNDELQSYIDSYPQYLENVKNQGKNISVLSIYADDFSRNNIQKTIADYERLSAIELQSGDNRAVVVFSDYRLTDMILLGLMLAIAVSYSAERSKGLVLLVRSAKNGRAALYLQRIAVLAICSVMLSLVLYASNIITAAVAYDGINLIAPIQSVPEFQTCAYKISILGYLLSTVLIKAVSAFISACIVYFLMLILKNSLFIIATAIICVIEVLLAVTIEPTSTLNGLRFVNLYTLLQTDVYFRRYCNLNFFSHPIGFLKAALVILLLTAAAIIAIGAIVSKKKYFTAQNTLNKLTVKIKELLHKYLPCGGDIYYEVKKLFVNQGAAVVIVVMFYLVFSSLTKYEYLYFVDPNEEHWYRVFSGEITAGMNDEIQLKLDEFQYNIDYYTAQIEEESSKENPNVQRLQNLYGLLQNDITQKAALEKVHLNVLSGLEYTKESGITVENIMPFSWRFLLCEDKATVNTASMYIMLMIILMTSGIFSYDTQNNMSAPIRSFYRGRKRNVLIKLSVVSLVSLAFAIAVHRIQYNMIGEVISYNNSEAIVQSLAFMRDFPFLISIESFITILFALRGAAAVALSLAVAFVSRHTPDRITSLVVSVFALAVPSMLLTSGFDFKYSLINLLGGLFII